MGDLFWVISIRTCTELWVDEQTDEYKVSCPSPWYLLGVISSSLIHPPLGLTRESLYLKPVCVPLWESTTLDRRKYIGCEGDVATLLLTKILTQITKGSNHMIHGEYFVNNHISRKIGRKSSTTRHMVQLEIKRHQDGKQKFLFASAGPLSHLALSEKDVILDLLRN